MIGFDRVLRTGDDDEWLAVSACVVKLCFCDCFSVMRLYVSVLVRFWLFLFLQVFTIGILGLFVLRLVFRR